MPDGFLWGEVESMLKLSDLCNLDVHMVDGFLFCTCLIVFCEREDMVDVLSLHG